MTEKSATPQTISAEEMAELDLRKKELRKAAKAARAQAFAADPDVGRKVCDHVFASLALFREADPANTVVSVYWPLGDELDPMPLLNNLHERGFVPVLPVMEGDGKPLIFRRWAPGDELVDAGFGTREPSADKEELFPDIILAPLLAFDSDGYRLGYGGGFYDRTLAKLRAFKQVAAIGVAYAAQEMPAVIRGPYDQPLDAIVTEEGAKLFTL